MSFIIQAVVMLFMLDRRIGGMGLRAIIKPTLKMIVAASVIMGAVLWAMKSLTDVSARRRPTDLGQATRDAGACRRRGDLPCCESRDGGGDVSAVGTERRRPAAKAGGFDWISVDDEVNDARERTAAAAMPTRIHTKITSALRGTCLIDWHFTDL